MVFTSAKGSPSAGDWGNITVDGGSGSLLENIELRYSGNGGLIFNHSSATEIRNATFEHNAEGALHYQYSDNNKISGSIFKNNSNTKSLQFENENGYTDSYEHAAGLTLYRSDNNLVESSNFSENSGSQGASAICVAGKGTPSET